MPEYRVRWLIDIEAGTPEEAARKALEIHRDTNSIATVFVVQKKVSDVQPKYGHTQKFDLTALGNKNG